MVFLNANFAIFIDKVSACKSPKVLVHRFEGWERPERISAGTTVASFLDWLLAIDRTLCVEDMKIVQRVFGLAPTLIGTEELTAAIAQKYARIWA
jgi:hypothetical protein